MFEIRNILLTLVLCHFALLSISQEIVFGIVPCGQSIQKQKASAARLIMDINPNFPTSWIKEYVSVDLSVTSNGQILKAKGSGFQLNSEQQHILKQADTGSDIQVAIKYYPENNLPKEVKEMNFTFLIAPDVDAEFPGGRQSMKAYLQKNIIDQLSNISSSEVHEAKVSFVITENGEVSNVKTLARSHSAKIDALLIRTLADMPKWTPAQIVDGTIVSQNFEFIVTRDLCVYGYLATDE